MLQYKRTKHSFVKIAFTIVTHIYLVHACRVQLLFEKSQKDLQPT